MRGFFYGLTGLVVSLILFKYEVENIVILSTIICGCTGAIVSAMESEKENILTEDNNTEKIE